MDSALLLAAAAGASVGFAIIGIIGVLFRWARHPNTLTGLLKTLAAVIVTLVALYVLSVIALRVAGVWPLGALSQFFGIGFLGGAAIARFAGLGTSRRRRRAA